MRNPIGKIILIIAAIAVLPVIVLTYKEISNLSENEKVLNDIYRNQLESILFSVNQYSEDIARSWISKIEAANPAGQNKQSNDFKAAGILFASGSAPDYVVIADSSVKLFREYKRVGNLPPVFSKSILSWKDISLLKSLIERLYRYKANNFQKIEPLTSADEKRVQFVAAVLNNGSLCFLGFGKNEFVSQILVNKIQSVSKGEFVITVSDNSAGNIVYSTDSNAPQSEGRKQPLWIIPDYSLSVALRGDTVESLVKERSLTNIYFIAGLFLIMLVFGWYALRNIRKEIELAKIKSDFVSNVSHELRTPLALINMFAETLAMGRVRTEEKKNEYYNIIQQETGRLSKIVNKILSFSKMEAGKWKYSFTENDLNEIAGIIYNNYKFHTENLGFDFSFEPADDRLIINADTEAVSEAVINLIDNAIKYSGDTKQIIMRAGTEGAYAFLEVRDQGIGISKEDQKKIFDKFYRVTHGDLHNTKGTGLGLALVKHIMNAHKGDIRLKSEPGKGASFVLLFPAGIKNTEKT